MKKTAARRSSSTSAAAPTESWSSTGGKAWVRASAQGGAPTAEQRLHQPTCRTSLSVLFVPTGVSERLGRHVYCGFEANSGEFAVIYEWALHWNKKMSKFFTSQEKGRIENCKKQASSTSSRCDF